MSIAGKVMSMVEQLSPMRRFYKFVVRRLIGPYLKYDPNLEELEIKLGEGSVVLCNLELNPVTFNQMLAQTGANLRIASGMVEELCITIPWRNLLDKSCKLYVRGVEIILSVGAAVSPQPGCTTEGPEAAEPESLNDVEDSGSEGVQVLERWIEGVLSRLQIVVDDLKIRIDHCSQQLNGRFFGAELQLHHLKYRDTTLEDQVLNDMEVAAGLRGRPKKEIKFQQLQIYLSEGETGAVPAALLSSRGHAEGHDNYLCVTLGSSTDPTEIDLCFFMHALDCEVTALQMLVLAEIASGLLCDSSQSTESFVEQSPSLYNIGAEQLSQSLRLGDFCTIEQILNIHEGVSMDQLSAEVPDSPNMDENKLFYSTIYGDSDVFSSFMHSSMHSGSSSPPGSPMRASMDCEMQETAAVTVTTRMHIEHLGFKVVVDDRGQGLLLESKIVSNTWSVGGMHCDIKANPLRLYQCLIDSDGSLTQEVVVGFGPKMSLSQDLSMSMHMIETVPDLHLKGSPSTAASTHFELQTQHLYGSCTSETLVLLGQLSEAVACVGDVFESQHSEGARKNTESHTVMLTLPSLELSIGSSLRWALGVLTVEVDRQGEVQLQLESLEIMLLQESEDDWSRVPITVARASSTSEPFTMRVRSNDSAAAWMPPPMGHSSSARHALQAAAVAASPTFVHIAVPQCDITLNSTTYAAIMHLFDSDPDSDPDGEPAEANAPTHQNLQYSLLVTFSNSNWQLSEDHAPEVARAAVLPDLNPAVYSAVLGDASIFFAQGTSSRSWLAAQLGSVSISETCVGHDTRPVLARAPQFGVEHEEEALPVLSALCAFGEDDGTTIELLVQELVYLYHVGSLWPLRVQDFFVAPFNAISPSLDQGLSGPPQMTKLTVDLHQILLFHQPKLHRAAVLVHLAKAQLCTNIIDQCPDIVLWLRLTSVQGFLTKKAATLSEMLQDAGTLHKEFLPDLVGMHGAVNIMALTGIEMTVTVSELAPMLDIDVRNPKSGKLTISLCADSCCELTQFIEHWVDAVDAGGLVLPPLMEHNAQMEQSMLLELLGDIDPLAFGPCSGAQGEMDRANQLPFVIDDFYRVESQPNGYAAARAESSCDSRPASGIHGGWVESPMIVNDYFNTRSADNEVLKGLGVLGELDEQGAYPMVLSKMTLTGVNVSIEMYGGFDWADQLPCGTVDDFMPRPSNHEQEEDEDLMMRSMMLMGRDKTTMLRLEIVGAMARYWEFEPRQDHSWRLVAMVHDVELYDCLSKSTWKKFLTRSRRFGEQHGSRAMVKVELGAVHPDRDALTEDWDLKLSFVPLKLNIDQDALDFLLAFLSFEADGIEEDIGPLPPPIFFQRFELSELKVCIDYKAKHFDLAKVRSGRYEEFANLLSLEGMELSLSRVQMAGISGWANVGTHILCEWAPSIWDSQIHRYAQSVQPVRSMSNLASGMFDLIYLPMCDERSVLRGAQRGTASCAWKVSLEVMSVATRMAVTAQIALENVRDNIAPENNTEADPRSKFSNAPGTVTAGLKQAYNSLSVGLKRAADSLVKKPSRAHKSAQQGYTASLLQGVLGVGIVTAEATSKVLLGVRNTLDPTNQMEERDKYK